MRPRERDSVGNYLTLDLFQRKAFTGVIIRMQERGRSDSTGLPAQPLADSLDRPLGMFRDQWLRVDRSAFECSQVFGSAYIAQRNAHVSKKTATFDSFDW